MVIVPGPSLLAAVIGVGIVVSCGAREASQDWLPQIGDAYRCEFDLYLDTAPLPGAGPMWRRGSGEVWFLSDSEFWSELHETEFAPGSMASQMGVLETRELTGFVGGALFRYNRVRVPHAAEPARWEYWTISRIPVSWLGDMRFSLHGLLVSPWESKSMHVAEQLEDLRARASRQSEWSRDEASFILDAPECVDGADTGCAASAGLGGFDSIEVLVDDLKRELSVRYSASSGSVYEVTMRDFEIVSTASARTHRPVVPSDVTMDNASRLGFLFEPQIDYRLLESGQSGPEEGK